MENVLADEALDMGGEYDFEAWNSIIVSLYGDIDLSESVDDPLDYIAAMEAQQIEIPSPS